MDGPAIAGFRVYLEGQPLSVNRHCPIRVLGGSGGLSKHTYILKQPYSNPNYPHY